MSRWTDFDRRRWRKAAGRINGQLAHFFRLQKQHPEIDVSVFLDPLMELAHRHNSGERSPALLKAMLERE